MKFIKKLLVVLLTCSINLGSVVAQVPTIVKGYITDSENGEPIPYATVSVPEQNIGISANLDGYFYLQISEPISTHHLQITSIGYEKYFSLLNGLNISENLRISLVPRTTLLEEVLVVGKLLSAGEIMQEASKKLKKNLGKKPYLLNGLYRETLKIDGKYTGLTEGVAMFYLDGYSKDHNTSGNDRYTYDLAQWKQMRRSDYLAPDSALIPKFLIIPKLFKAKDYYLYQGPLQSSNLSRFQFEIDSLTEYENQMVYIIKFTPKSPGTFDYQGKVYLKENDFGLLAMDISGTPGPNLYHRGSSEPYDLAHTFHINYTLFQDRYYISYLNLTYQYKVEIDSHPYLVEANTEVLGGQFSKQKVERLDYAQLNVLYGEMLNPVINYNQQFWQDFPYALSSDEAIFIDLINVKEQFERHHNMRLIPLPDEFGSYEEIYNDRVLFDVFFQDF